MKKSVAVKVEKLSHDGRGIAYLNQKPIFITGALPEEEATSTFLRSYKGITDAVATDIINPAQNRVTPPCKHYLTCGGCNLQHLAPKDQVNFKQNMLIEHLTHQQIDLKRTEILDPIESESLHYRKKARMGVKYIHKKEKLVIGFRELINPRLVAEIDKCIVLDKQVGLHLDELKQMICNLSQPDKIAQIEVAIGDDDCVLILRHLYPLTDSDYALLKTFEATHHFSLFLQSKGPDTITPLNPDHSGELHYTLKAYNLTMYFKPDHFTQVNHEVNEKMIARALELLQLEKTDRVLDLFSGIGNFTLAMAQLAQSVVGVEGSAQMTNYAATNAKRNQIENVAFYPYDLTKPITKLPWTQQPYDKLLIDPPRSGAKEICESIKQVSPKTIVYISCNLITFARDAKILVDSGYRLTHTGILDMFPNTAHVESMGRFELK